MPQALLVLIALVFGSATAAHAQIAVVSTSPALNDNAAVTASVSVEFDRALDTATVNASSFRVFGRGSGTATGAFIFSNGNKTVTLTPNDPFTAGEIVFVNLANTIKGADATTLRSAGYAFQFTTATAPAAAVFSEIDTFSNRTGGPGGPQTRIYGAAATDLDNDEYLDLATVNEVSADVRVFLNTADGSGLYGAMLPREGIGVEASPNDPADFDNDGLTDLCVAAASSHSVSILLGAGDGSFSSNQEITVGTAPHGIVPLDVDGDADLDIVNANVDSDELSLLINDGNGSFGAPTFFEGGVNGEYGLAQGDMNGDGITDLVVAGRNGAEIVTQLGNGDGTFNAAGPAQATGGNTWVVVLGDVDGDGVLDAVTANPGTNTVGILIGDGDGTFAPADTISIGSHIPSVDLGDLDGDGDLDMVVSSYGGSFWRRFENDGTGSFSFVEDIPAPSNPSCSILLDFDNDGDLDMALTDEIADVVVLMQNGGIGSSGCTPAPTACREPIAEGKAKLTLVDRSPSDKDKIIFTWTKGEATSLSDFGDPLTTDAYDLCLYEDGVLQQGFEIPAAGTCDGRPCWSTAGSGLSYRDKELTPDGIATVKLTPGDVDGKSKLKVTGKGTRLGLPAVSGLDQTIEIQLQRKDDARCWGATFTQPFTKNDGVTLKASSGAPDPAVPAPVWSEIFAEVVGPTCGGCHGAAASGGLTGLDDCNTGYASLVGVASVRLATMDRVEPGDALSSFLMHKLDGTQSAFNALCSGGFCGSQMPIGTPLSTEVRDAIRAWITNGAVNDCP
jgi:hypothetical protein